MASSDLRLRLNNAKRDLDSIVNSQNFNRIKNMSALLQPWSEAKDLALKWMTKADPVLSTVDDSSLQPLELFARRLAEIGDGREVRQNEAIPDAIRRVRTDFQQALPLLAYDLLEASGILEFSKESLHGWKEEAVSEVRTSVDKAADQIKLLITEADTNLKASAVEAGKDFELAKAKASKISVDSAQQQFSAAATGLRTKAIVWTSLSGIFFGALVFLLIWFSKNPPMLVRDVIDAMKPSSKVVALPVSIPLLITASAYFTSIRLALIGILGIGLAFSLRMTRAYFHMIEHNQHKLRVTNSIEAFVAAVRTNEQKDLVLSKLVESVTEFGDSGILGQEEKPSGLPSVIFETMTKNVGKSD